MKSVGMGVGEDSCCPIFVNDDMLQVHSFTSTFSLGYSIHGSGMCNIMNAYVQPCE